MYGDYYKKIIGLRVQNQSEPRSCYSCSRRWLSLVGRSVGIGGVR